MNGRFRTTTNGTASLIGIALASIVLVSACGSSHPSTAAARYDAIAKIGNRSLDRDFDALEDHDHDSLTAARADYRDAAATERRFDHSLLAMSFPPATEATARALVRVNASRASLTSRAAASTSLAELLHFEPQISAANGPVEQQVKTLRRQLGLPPPDAS